MSLDFLFRRSWYWSSLLAVLAMFCFCCPEVSSQVSPAARKDRTEPGNFRFETIDYPGAVASRALGINSQGTVVGSFDDSSGTHGFVLNDRGFQVIDVVGSSSTQVKCMNVRGEAVGYYLDSDFNLHGFYWFRGKFRMVDVPFSMETRAEGINDEGRLLVLIYGQPAASDGACIADRVFPLRHSDGAQVIAALAGLS